MDTNKMAFPSQMRIFNAFSLKMIAAVTMLIDHVGFVLFPEHPIFRYIGRIAMPIFAFLLVEGFLHTKNVKKYMFRLLIFALLTEIPFDYAFYGEFTMTHQNIMFTFLFAMAVMCTDKYYGRVAGYAAMLLLGVLAEFLHLDYGLYGVAIVLILYWAREFLAMQVTVGALTLVLLAEGPQRFAALAMIPIALYNGKKGIGLKYFFYIFYPAHLALLYVCVCYIF